VLRKEVRGRRVLPNNDSDEEPTLFQMGRDEDFEGLRPDRDVGEQEVLPSETGENVLLEPVVRAYRGVRGGRGDRRRSRGGRGGRRGAQRGPIVQPAEDQRNNSEEDEQQEEDRLYRENIAGGVRRRRRTGAQDNENQNRNTRQRHHSEPHGEWNDNASSEEDKSISKYSTSETCPSSSESSGDGQVIVS
jgi:hypothetical protein